jgi:uncharacterized protein
MTSTAPLPPAIPAAEVAAWRDALVRDRATTDDDMRTDPTSPLAAIERHTPTGPGPTYLGVRGDHVAVDERADGAVFALRAPAPDQWAWERVDPAAVAPSTDGKPLEPGPITARTLFRVGRFQVMAQTASGTFVVTAYDPANAAVRAFRQLTYFPPEPRLAVTARIHRIEDPKVMQLQTSLGLTKPYQRFATLAFEIDGKPYQLTAFRPAGATSGALFLPFRDATSGKATYGAGRFLDLDEPRDRAATLTLDFNRAYNPLCNYSSAFNCPLPPPENVLAVAIEAGQQTYTGLHAGSPHG